MIKQSKKLLSLCLALALVLGTVLIAVPASAAGDMTINFASVNAAPGETVDVPVTFTNNTGVCSGNLYFSYDSTALEFVGATFQGSYASGSASVNVAANKLTFGCLNDVTEASFVVAQFKVKDTAAAGEYAISFTNLNDFLDGVGNDVTATLVPGKITVSGKLNGVYDDPEITLIDEDFATVPTDWSGADNYNGGKANITDHSVENKAYPIYLTSNVLDNLDAYTLTADLTIGPKPANADDSDKAQYYTVTVARNANNVGQGVECAVFHDKDNLWKIRIYDRKLAVAIGTKKCSDVGLGSVVDFGKTFSVKVVLGGGSVSYYINDTLILSGYLQSTTASYAGSIAFCAQYGAEMSVDNVKVTARPTTGRNKLLHKGFALSKSNGQGRSGTTANAFAFGYHVTNGLDGNTDNMYFTSGNGVQLNFSQIDGYYNPTTLNGTTTVAFGDALNWKNYDAEVSLKLNVKNSAPTAYDAGTQYAALVFGAIQDDAAKKSIKGGNRFAVAYDRTNAKYTYGLMTSGTTSYANAVLKADVPAECGIGAFDDTKGSPFFKLRVELFGALAKFYINDVYVNQYTFTAPVVGTAGVAISGGTSITFNMKDLVVVTDYVTPRTPAEGEVFFEGFGNYGPDNNLTLVNGVDERPWDFSNGTAKLDLKGADSTASNKQWFITYMNADAYNWSNMTYSTDIKFDWLPANYTEAGREDAGGSAYWGFNIVEATKRDSSIEAAIYRDNDSPNAWHWRLYRRPNSLYTGTKIEKSGVINDAATLAKLNGKEYVNMSLAIYGNQITFTVNGVVCYDSDEMGYSPAGSIRLVTYTRSNSIFEFDNIQVKATPKKTHASFSHDFTEDNVNDVLLTKANGWAIDSTNKVVETAYGKALSLTQNVSWGDKLSNVRINAKIALKWKDNTTRAGSNSAVEAAFSIANNATTSNAAADAFRFRGFVNRGKVAEGYGQDGWNICFFTPSGALQRNPVAFTYDATGLTPVYDISLARVGNYYEAIVDGVTVLSTVADASDAASVNMTSEEKTFNIALMAGSKMEAYIYDLEILPYDDLYTVSADNDAEIAKYPTIGTFDKAAEQQVFATRNFYGEGDTVKIVAENAAVGSVKYTDGDGNAHNIFATGAEKGTADGKTFQFTMPASDVTVTATAMDTAVQNFGISTLSYSTSIDGPAALRFLNRVYLPKVIEGEGFSSTVLYNGEEYTITDIGAIIVPEEVNSNTLDLNADSIKKVSVLETNTIYDRTDSYVDFTVYLTGIQDGHKYWNFRVRAYVELFDGENTIVVYGDELDARYDSK